MTGTPCAENPVKRTRRRPVAFAALGLAFLLGCGQESNPGGSAAATPTSVSTTVTTETPQTTVSIDFSQPVIQATAPLAAGATADEVILVATDMRGPSDSPTDQLLRLAPFPDIGRPFRLAQLLEFEILLEPESDDDVYPSVATVTFRVPESLTSAQDILASQLLSRAWSQVDGTTTDAPATADGDDDDRRIIKIESTHRRPVSGDSRVKLTTTVEAAAGATIVTLTAEAESTASAVTEDRTTYFSRLSDWTDDVTLPRGADLLEVGVETAETSGRLWASYLDEGSTPEETVEAIVDRLGSDDTVIDQDAAAGTLSVTTGDGVDVIYTATAVPVSEDTRLEVEVRFELDPVAD